MRIKSSVLILVIIATGCRKHLEPPKVTPSSVRSVALNWTASVTAGVDYYVYRALGSCSSATNFAKINTTVLTGVTYTDSGVADGTYCYYVTSHLATAIPNESGPSNKAEALVQSQPQPPTNLTVTPTTANLILNQKQQFTASRSGATWSINPPDIGTISSTGLYTAPSSIKGNNINVEVIARESGESATAMITLRKN